MFSCCRILFPEQDETLLRRFRNRPYFSSLIEPVRRAITGEDRALEAGDGQPPGRNTDTAPAHIDAEQPDNTDLQARQPVRRAVTRGHGSRDEGQLATQATVWHGARAVGTGGDSV